MFRSVRLSVYSLLLSALCFLPGVQAQNPEDTPLFLGSGVRVDHHPNDVPEYELYAPKTSEICAPEDMGNSCGRVWWNSRQQPVLGKRYITQVPAMVRLRGPGRDAWWIPFAHCLVENADKKLRSAGPPGVQCVTILKQPEERMEWAVGGIAEGIDQAVPGTYIGIIPLMVSGPGTRWELDIPVVYTVHTRQAECGLRYGQPRNIDFGTAPATSTEMTDNMTLSVSRCNESLVAKWEIRDLGPTESGPSFELDISPRTGIREGSNTDIDNCNVGEPSSRENIKFTASGFSALPPGTYTRKLELRVWCE